MSWVTIPGVGDVDSAIAPYFQGAGGQNVNAQNLAGMKANNPQLFRDTPAAAPATPAATTPAAPAGPDYSKYSQDPLPSTVFDPNYYQAQHPDVALAVGRGEVPSAQASFLSNPQGSGVAPWGPTQNHDLLNSIFGINTDTGAGQGEDLLLRQLNDGNSAGVNKYVSTRQASQPGYTFDSTRQSDAVKALAEQKARARTAVTAKGLNYDELAPDIEQTLTDIYKQIPYGATNSQNYFDPSIVDTSLGKIQDTRRQKYTTDFTNLLPDNYADSQFGDTSDDDIINNILGEQYGSALGRVDANKKRGVLNNAGYSTAVSDLDKQKVEANSKLQSVGGNVLNTDRGQLNDILTKGKTAAGSYTLGQTYDPNTYKTQADAKAADLKGRLEGDIRSQAAPDSLFDTSRSLATGGTAQGAQNGTRQGVLDVLASKQAEQRQKRGVGSQGVF